MSYKKARDGAVGYFVQEKQSEFDRKLRNLLRECVPVSYDNPLGQFPKLWEDVIEEMCKAAAKNYKGQAETKLFSTMQQSMLSHLRGEDSGNKED